MFSPRAFPFVNAVIGALSLASILVFGLAIVALIESRSTPPGGEDAPGLVILFGLMSLVVAGVALVVYVLRLLLAQAVALDSTAKHLRSELDEVI